MEEWGTQLPLPHLRSSEPCPAASALPAGLGGLGWRPDAEARLSESHRPPPAFWSSGGPGLSLGPVSTRGLPPTPGSGSVGFPAAEAAGGPPGGRLGQAGEREVGKDEGKRLAFIKSRKFIS